MTCKITAAVCSFSKQTNLKNKVLKLFVQTNQKTKKVPHKEMSRDKTKKDAHISNEWQLQNHSLTFSHKNNSLLSPTSILSRSSMGYITTASLDKLTCADYVHFGKSQDIFGFFVLEQEGFQLLGCKTQSFQEE